MRMMLKISGVTLLAATASCSGQSGSAANTTNASAAATTNAAPMQKQGGNVTAPAAADEAGARAFLANIYARYAPDAPEPQGNRPPPPPFTPELNEHIRRTSAMEDGGLDFDPFCQCQDYQNLTWRIETMTRTAEGFNARVAIVNMGDSRTIPIRLVHRGGAWLVADIGEGQDSLLNSR